jgi:hypothetical protein
VAQAGGDISAARAFFKKALEIRKELSDAYPQNGVLLHDLSVSYERLGGVAQAARDFAAAHGFFDDGLEILKTLSEKYPQNVEWQLDLALSHARLVSVTHQMKDSMAVRVHRNAAIEILNHLKQTERVKDGDRLATLYDALYDALAEIKD